MSDEKIVDVVFRQRFSVFNAGEKAGFPESKAMSLVKQKIAALTKPLAERMVVKQAVDIGPFVEDGVPWGDDEAPPADVFIDFFMKWNKEKILEGGRALGVELDETDTKAELLGAVYEQLYGDASVG